MPRIDDEILNCSIYLYETMQYAQDGEKSGGSGFLVAVPSSVPGNIYVYAVTNSHVIREGNSSIVRLNKKTGEAVIHSSDPSDWNHHPEGDDLAVLPISGLEDIRFAAISINRFIDDNIIEEIDMGPGEEVFMVGRFIGYDGKQKNEPIVRFGNLSIVKPVDIEHERGLKQESYLIESRSLSGFSGSPVFIHILPFTDRRKKGLYSAGRGPWLLGIDWGHNHFDEFVRDRSGEIVAEKWKVRTNTGISCVVPAWKLAELLNIEKLAKARKVNDRDIIASQKEQ